MMLHSWKLMRNYGSCLRIQVCLKGLWRPAAASASIKRNSSALYRRVTEQGIGPRELRMPGHLMEMVGVCALSHPISLVNSSPHSGHLNGHVSLSSYKTRSPPKKVFCFLLKRPWLREVSDSSVACPLYL